MKRMSIAESTLKKQIEQAYLRMTAIDHDMELLGQQRFVYQQLILDLETEQTRLRAVRELASKRNSKP